MRRELLASVSAIALLVASGSAALFSNPADAADLRPAYKAPPPAPAPVYSWTGCYVGAHVGWGWGSNNMTENSIGFTSASATAGVDTSGGLFGGQVGCNYQFAGNWVVGLQGDFAGTDFNGRANDPFDKFDSFALRSNWLGSITGHLGATFLNNQALAYVKGGVAWIHNQWDFHDASFDFPNQFSETRSGWTIGGGFEWTLWSPAWTAFVEYNFYQFNHGSTRTCSDCEGSNVQTGRQQINTVKVGVNYKFNGFLGQ